MGQRATDHYRQVANGRQKYFFALDRQDENPFLQSGRHSQHRQPDENTGATRLQHFLRIDRGRAA
ncbi:MAG: hypothetical protein WBA91_01300 [Paracoccaceae bacterium]